MRIAVIADIHGNLPALEAVLAEIAASGAALTINLGDVASGPLWPREALLRVQESGMPVLRGNHDRWVAEGGEGATDRIARAALTAAEVAWLGALPVLLEPVPGLVAFHACPADDTAYLLEEVALGQLVSAAPAAVAARLGPLAAGVVLCGHSHRAGVMQLPDGRVVVNPGSVGCPAYADPTPPAHVSEAGSPLARYAMIEVEEGRLRRLALCGVAYDHEAAAACAARQGRPDWARALRTGAISRGGGG